MKREFYEPILSEKELQFGFGHYLDEHFVKEETKTIEPSFDDYPSYNDDYISYDSDNWLIDAAGTDDPETMNDVYWNLD